MSSYLGRFLFIVFVMIAFFHQKEKRGKENRWNTGGILLVSGDGDADKKLRDIFISDIKKLLEHNHQFYNTYGTSAPEVDLAFEEAIIAADVIFLNPEIFRYRVQKINERIADALSTKQKVDSDITADGVPVFFVGNQLVLLGAVGGGGILRFPRFL